MNGPEQITVDELQQRLKQQPAPVLLDVLTADAHAEYSLPGSVHACVFEMSFLDNVAKLVPGPTTPLVIIGAGGDSHDAAAAADKLERAGYSQVEILDGGRRAWRAAELPAGGTAAEPSTSPAPPALAPGSWQAVTVDSKLHWIGRNANGPHDGAVDPQPGEITVTDSGVSGRIPLDLATLRNFDLEGESSQPYLIAHLLSDDFLFSERFPEVAYLVDGVRPLPDATLTTATHRVQGRLTMRGVTAGLDFDATVSALPQDRLAVTARFDIDRTRWGLLYGSARFFEHLGMHAVFDAITIDLRLVLARA